MTDEEMSECYGLMADRRESNKTGDADRSRSPELKTTRQPLTERNRDINKDHDEQWDMEYPEAEYQGDDDSDPESKEIDYPEEESTYHDPADDLL